MATITGLTAERMQEIEAASIVDSKIVNGELILIRHDGTEVNTGSVIGPPGPQGPMGPVAISAIPGEVKLWPSDVLPVEATYGKWVWADGMDYPNASHPKAAVNISPLWKTYEGASDPGLNRFRVPDLRGVVPGGLDQMPSPSTRGRAGRMTRADAIILAKKTGRETYDLKIGEMPSHSHRADGQAGAGGQSGAADRSLDHLHNMTHDHAIGLRVTWDQGGYTAALGGNGAMGDAGGGGAGAPIKHFYGTTLGVDRGIDHLHGINPNGNNGAHETVQPTVMIPYIVYLDVV